MLLADNTKVGDGDILDLLALELDKAAVHNVLGGVALGRRDGDSDLGGSTRLQSELGLGELELGTDGRRESGGLNELIAALVNVVGYQSNRHIVDNVVGSSGLTKVLDSQSVADVILSVGVVEADLAGRDVATLKNSVVNCNVNYMVSMILLLLLLLKSRYCIRTLNETSSLAEGSIDTRGTVFMEELSSVVFKLFRDECRRLLLAIERLQVQGNGT